LRDSRSCRERRWLRPEPINAPQNFFEQRPRYGRLGPLEHHVTAVATILAPIFTSIARNAVSAQ
jgi:hypothetical protein